MGALLFEYAWASVKPIREVNEERDSKYPAFRRWDAAKWRKWKFYPGAITIMPLRVIATIFLILLCYIFIRIGTIGHSFKGDKPIRGWCRNIVISYTMKFFNSVLLLSLGCWSWKTKVEFDYSEYLGPGYRANLVGPKHISTYVSNHTGWIDIVTMISYFRPAFAAKQPLRNIPIFGLFV